MNQWALKTDEGGLMCITNREGINEESLPFGLSSMGWFLSLRESD